MAEYSVDFRILAAESGWNDQAIRGAYLFGLYETIRMKLHYVTNLNHQMR